MKQGTKKWLNRIRKAIPIIYIAIYLLTWCAFVKSLADVVSGDKYLLPEYEYNLSQLTAYVQILYLGIFVLLSCMLMRYMFTPDRTSRYRIVKLEREVAYLKEKSEVQSDFLTRLTVEKEVEEDEGDSGDSDGRSDGEESGQIEKIE